MRGYVERDETGFTLIELVVVVGIIGLLAAIAVVNLIPAERRVRYAKAAGDTKEIITQALVLTSDNNAVAIFKALQGTRGSALLEPDTVVMHPTNWQATRLLTDTAGQFFGGGPFTGAYGNAGGIPVSADGGQLTGAYDTLWGKRVIVTTAVGGAGTALVGSFRSAAQLWRRSGLSVEATNSHSDYFTKNLVALRAEERLALAVYRPSAFTAITGLD